jgi:8-oxo-dGTP diphosphatase
MKKLSPEVLRTHKGISFVGVTTTFLCHDGKGNFVMAKRGQNARDEQGRWEIGAGGLKAGTPILENVKREIKEEYNAKALEIEYMGYRDMHRKLDDGTPTHWVALDFAVLVDPQASN